jgi:hypothetical protein
MTLEAPDAYHNEEATTHKGRPAEGANEMCYRSAAHSDGIPLVNENFTPCQLMSDSPLRA